MWPNLSATKRTFAAVQLPFSIVHLIFVYASFSPFNPRLRLEPREAYPLSHGVANQILLIICSPSKFGWIVLIFTLSCRINRVKRSCRSFGHAEKLVACCQVGARPGVSSTFCVIYGRSLCYRLIKKTVELSLRCRLRVGPAVFFVGGLSP